ncbi:uncharacterized protein [Drosophila virilis]|uniref:Uncharacterized protein, isoform B n=1 Tax=Drosophila virilis TaxID=7244 RepID=A0A0Q9WEG6_DROVI|nr:uncharacterized protein LOC6631337 isoform X2 [Drosophila virilis]KRF82518.1 uncharacterized protein Dvir_GJ19545, isoform B [Drosophila virilis]
MSSTSSSVLALSSFNLLFFTQVLTVLSITIKYNEYATDKGGNVSIPCIAQGNIMWVKEHGSNSTIIQTGRILVLRNVSTSDGGIYVCFATLPVTTTRATSTTATAMPATAATTSSQQQQQQTLAVERGEQEPNAEEVEVVEQAYQAYQRIKLTVRTTPGPVSQLYFKASTILGFLIWRFNKTQSGGYPVRSFTAEYRNVSYRTPPANASYEHEWSRMDPINIAPNVRQMEVYRLAPNTTYEFRIWANNELGSGEVVTTNVTTLPETKEEDLIRLIKPDLDNFDPRIWIVAVSIVLGTLVILAIGLCIVLSKECYQSTQMVNPTELRTCSRLRATFFLATRDSNIPIMLLMMKTMTTMMITRRRRIWSRQWKSSSAKFRYSLQVPPSNVFESTKCNFMATPIQIYLGC